MKDPLSAGCWLWNPDLVTAAHGDADDRSAQAGNLSGDEIIACGFLAEDESGGGSRHDGSGCGCVRVDENIISTGGSSSGLDTALVLQPANTHSFLDVKIREVLCKPANFLSCGLSLGFQRVKI